MDTAEASRYHWAAWRHWSDRLVGIIALIFLVTYAVRIAANGGINTDLSVGRYVVAGAWIVLLLLAVYKGVRAWMRSEPKLSEGPIGKRISDEVMDLGHGEFDPVWVRRNGIKHALVWSAIAFASGAFYYLADDDV